MADLFDELEAEAPAAAQPAAKTDIFDEIGAEPTSSAAGDFARRIPAGAAQAALSSAAGLLRFQDSPLGRIVMPIINPASPVLPSPFRQATADFLSEAAGNARESFGVDPMRDETTLAQTGEAVGGLGAAVPLIAAGGLPAFIGMGAQAFGGAKEADYQRAIAEGLSEEEAQAKSTRTAAIKTGVTLPLYALAGAGANRIAAAVGEGMTPLKLALVRFGANALGNVGSSSVGRGVEAGVEGEPILPAMGDFSIPALVPDIAFASHATIEGYRGDTGAIRAARGIVDGTSDLPVYQAHIEAAKAATTPEEKLNVARSMRMLVGSAHDVLERFGQADADTAEAQWYRDIQDKADSAAETYDRSAEAEQNGLPQTADELRKQAALLHNEVMEAIKTIPPEKAEAPYRRPAEQLLPDTESGLFDRGTPAGDIFDQIERKPEGGEVTSGEKVQAQEEGAQGRQQDVLTEPISQPTGQQQSAQAPTVQAETVPSLTTTKGGEINAEQITSAAQPHGDVQHPEGASARAPGERSVPAAGRSEGIPEGGQRAQVPEEVTISPRPAAEAAAPAVAEPVAASSPSSTGERAAATGVAEIPPANDIVPAIRVRGQVIEGRKGETHQDVLNRYLSEHPDDADAIANFDTKENPNFFRGAGRDISREELKAKHGVSDSQGLRRIQSAEQPKTVTETALDPSVVSIPEGARGYKLKYGDATATVEEYADRIVLKDLVSLNRGQGDATRLLDELKSKGKPVELLAGKRSGDTVRPEFYEKRGFKAVEGKPGAFRFEPEGIKSAQPEVTIASLRERYQTQGADIAARFEKLISEFGEDPVLFTATDIAENYSRMNNGKKILPLISDLESNRDFMQRRKEATPITPEAAPAKTPAKTPAKPTEVLAQSERVKITAPEGATMLRVTPEKGAPIIESIKNVDSGGKLTGKKGMNVLQGAGPFKKIEAGVMGGKGGKEFVPIKGEVNVADARELSASRYQSSTPQRVGLTVVKGARHLEDVVRVTEAMKRAVQGVRVRVLRNEGDLPQEVRDMLPSGVRHEGLTDVQTGDVWLFSDHIANARRAAEVFAHEVVGHYGVEKIVGTKEWAGISDQIFRQHAAEAARIGKLYFDEKTPFDPKNEDHRRLVAKEYLARLAENPQQAPGLWRRVVLAVKSALRKLGIRREWSDEEITDLIRQAGKAVERGVQSETQGLFGARSRPIAPDEVDAMRAAGISVFGSTDVDTTGKRFSAAQLRDGSILYGDLAPEALTSAIPERLRANIESRGVVADGRFEPSKDFLASRVDEGFSTSTKEQVRQSERAARGLDDIEKEARVSNEATFAKAKDAVAKNPGHAKAIITGLLDGTKRDVSEVDEAVLLGEKVRLMNERNAAADLLDKPDITEAERTEAKARWNVLENDLNALDQATYQSGKIWGRFGQFRQRLMLQDYSFEALQRKARVTLDRPLTVEEVTKIKEQADRIAELERRVAQLESGRDQAGADTAADDQVKKLRGKAGKAKPVTPESIAEKMRGVMAEKDAEIGDLRGYVQKLALEFVRQGTTEREPLIDQVHGVLEEVVPGIERRQTQDLISGYGDYKPLDPDAAKATLRDLKGQMQQMAKLEDIINREPLRKTGVQRRVPSDEERRLIQRVNEAKKKYGVVTTDPETQLKSAQDAIRTRLKNQIKDITNIIETGERPAAKTPMEYDAQNERLRDLRDRLRQTLTELEGKPEMTDEQRVALMKRSLESQIGEYERRLRESDTSPRNSPKRLTTPEIEALRARRDALREEYREMESLDYDLQQSKIAKRNAAEEARLRESITDLDNRISTGDLEARVKPSREVSAEVERLRAERAAMQKLLTQLRNESKPKLTAEERALRALKARMANRTAELKEKLAYGDFEKKARPEIKLDKEALDLRAELQMAKNDYNRALMQKKLSERKLPRKIFDTGVETLNTSRAILTSMDFSGVFRQGGFIALGHPVRAAKILPTMFRSFASEKASIAAMEELKSRPNWDLYRRAKLEITDENADSLTKMEEQYASRWAQKIPLVAGSARSYTTFLNVLRADSFDAMVKGLGRDTIAPEEAEAIANFINVATGRGALSGKYRTAAAGLNSVFFAPRYVLSRFQLLGLQPLLHGTNATRKAVATEYARYIAGVGVVMALAIAGQDDKDPAVETDPRSSEFMKVRFGNTRLDPWSGLIQPTVLLSRLAAGATKTASGQVIPIRGDDIPYGGGTAADVIARFLRTKLSPAPGAFVNILSGETVVGEEVTPTTAARDFVVPITFSDLFDVMKEQGIAKGTALNLLSIFGFGLQNYDQSERRREDIRERLKKKGIEPTEENVDYEMKVSEYRSQMLRERKKLKDQQK